MKNDLLRALALKAKNRLIHKDNISQDHVKIKIIQNTDEDFYQKVKDLLMRDIDLVNPIKELMDETLMNSMNPNQKEKYLLQTVEKYQKVRSMLECEKELKVVY